MRSLILLVFIGFQFGKVLAQDVVPPPSVGVQTDRPLVARNFFMDIGYQNIQNREFSNRLVALGKSSLPTSYFSIGYGFNVVNEKWTILNIYVNTDRSSDFGDMTEFKGSFFYSNIRAGVAYNLFDIQNKKRLEAGVGLVYASGRYNNVFAQIPGTFDETISALNYNEFNLRQNNYGLNVNLLLTENQFFEPNKVSSNFLGLEVGANLMLLSGRLSPNLLNSPDFNLNTYYIKVRISVFTY